MKTLREIYRATLVALLFSLSGCLDLTEEPEGLVGDDTFYSSVAQGEAALAASMNTLWDYWSVYSYGYGYFIHDDQLMGGDLNIGPSHANALWERHYRAILNINGVIRGIKEGKIDAATPQSEIDALEGQAKFLRAFNYFMLVRLYGDLPLIVEDTPNPVTNLVERRTPVAEVYDLIVSDLTFAAEHLPLTWPGQPGKPAGGAAKGMLAKVYLTMATAPLNEAANYAKARDMAAEVMADGVHALTPNVFDVFKLENKYGPEMMFSFNSSPDDVATDPQIWGPAIMEGWGDASIDPVWSDKWLNDSPDEPRQQAYLVLEYNGVPYTDFEEQRPFIRKFSLPYISQEEYDTYSSTANIPILRYADVLLIYAEAANMAENGPSAAAYDAVNRVRRRAFNLPLDVAAPGVDLPAGLDRDAFDAAVIEERNVELSFEYDRWFDLVRKRMLDDVAGQYLPNFTEEDYLYPIPLYDAKVLGSQNPGYPTE